MKRCEGSGAVAFTFVEHVYVATTCMACGKTLAAELGPDDVWHVPWHQ